MGQSSIQHRLIYYRLRMLVFLDSSFANNDDSSTRLVFIVLITYQTIHAHCLHLAIYKSAIPVASKSDNGGTVLRYFFLTRSIFHVYIVREKPSSS